MSTDINVSQHRDILGRIINVGDFVAVSNGCLFIATVIKLNPKMVKIKPLVNRRDWQMNKYPNEMVVLNPDDVLMYLLKRGK